MTDGAISQQHNGAARSNLVAQQHLGVDKDICILARPGRPVQLLASQLAGRNYVLLAWLWVLLSLLCAINGDLADYIYLRPHDVNDQDAWTTDLFLCPADICAALYTSGTETEIDCHIWRKQSDSHH